VEQGVYRIAQETLENVVRHAEPQLIVVRLERNAGNLTFTVEDDGRGIDAATVRTSQTGGQDQLGIQGITERANLIGGQLQITSRSGQGTRVDLIVPLASRPVQGAPQAR
jgi:hypothetical protein